MDLGMTGAGPVRRVAAPVAGLIAVVRAGDSATVEAALRDLTRTQRTLAPLAFVVGALVMLFEALKLLASNWRLAVVQVVPAMWVWLAMLDLKVHVLGGKGFTLLGGTALVAAVAGVTAVTALSFFLNTVFAFAISAPGTPDIRCGYRGALAHLRAVAGWGVLVGVALGVATMISGRWGRGWFTLATGIAVGILMFCYVAVPARLIGASEIPAGRSPRDRIAAAVMAGVVGAVVCTPPYLAGRLGVGMLGSGALFVPGVILVVVGFGLQVGATGSVKAIKMSVKLSAGRNRTGS